MADKAFDSIKPKGELKPTSARERRKQSQFTVQISQDLVVTMRYMDMTLMLMQGLIPMHMLEAANAFEKMADSVARGKTSEEKSQALMQALQDPEKMKQSIEFLQHFARVVVISPVLVQEDDGNPDHLPVTDLTGQELIGIFYAHPQSKEEARTLVSRETAEDFRGDEPEAAPAPGLDGAEVRPTAELLDFGEREALHA